MIFKHEGAAALDLVKGTQTLPYNRLEVPSMVRHSFRHVALGMKTFLRSSLISILPLSLILLAPKYFHIIISISKTF
jgi:hypothetical protein